jgi:hypothetical protein
MGICADPDQKRVAGIELKTLIVAVSEDDFYFARTSSFLK